MTQFLEIVDSSLGSLLHGSQGDFDGSRSRLETGLDNMATNINIFKGMCFQFPCSLVPNF